MKTRTLLISISLIGAVIVSIFIANRVSSRSNQPPNAGLEVVRFANLPYADHTITAIGVEKGWFREVGIDLRATTIKVEEAVPALVNGKYDAASVPPGILFSAHDTAPGLISFVFSDLFQGFALMGQPGNGLKTYAEYRAEGKTHIESLAVCVGQLRGKTFAYPTETAVKPFIDQLLAAGGLKENDFKPLVLDDALTMSAMRKKEADFQVGGVPSRIVLEREGFIPLISSMDIARGAVASADSSELASILQNGWACTAKYYHTHYSTILKLASVNYRIVQFINENEDEALGIHMKYLSAVSGQAFSKEDGRIIYRSLDPFVTFENQRPWFFDTSNPMYYTHVNGAILKTFTSKNVYRDKPPGVEDVIYADDTYRDMTKLRGRASDLLNASKGDSSSVDIAGRAKKSFDVFDFAESVRLLEQLPARLPNAK